MQHAYSTYVWLTAWKRAVDALQAMATEAFLAVFSISNCVLSEVQQVIAATQKSSLT